MDVNNEYGALDVQKRLLRLLKEFDAFCIANEIKYSVIGGTLLGAIRHQGFIPWDDDLDIIVDRTNYNKIIRLLPDGCLALEQDRKISLWIDRIKLARDKDSESLYEFIDVFVLDNCPDNPFIASLKLFLVKILQGMIKPCPKFGEIPFLLTLLSFILYGLGRFFSYKTKMRMYQRLSVWGNGKNTRLKKIYNDEYSLLSKCYPGDILNSLIRLPFEDCEVYSIEKYDEYLKYIFGNYMILPDESKRHPIHKYLWNL